MKTEKRKIKLVVLSDIHLGTHGCRAKELMRYLKSIEPETLVLNGDIVDIWQFSKSYWPQAHTKVIRHIMGLMAKGVRVYYICGNHDEMMRRFVGFNLGGFSTSNQEVLELDGKKAWIFHGDVFDVSMQGSRWLAKLGGKSYDLLIRFNGFVNFILHKFGRERISLSKKIKDSVKRGVKKVHNWEKVAAGIGIDKGYDYVVVGHIHKPEIREIELPQGKILYLNSGDWIENLTALEYDKGEWSVFKYDYDLFRESPDSEPEMESPDTFSDEKTFERLLKEFEL